jgi:acyl-CoA thioesterase-1
LLQGVAGDARLNQADGIHPNIDGSKIVAATIWTALLPILTTLPGNPSSPTPNSAKIP